ncbi:MAG TPA: adenylate/guanylate cyclase domain-containing protein, partial [Chitinophagaceae bacterium]|nr:adenylate/guanylate cyclase domain-containing protein [Chitinophagaceae bacterium]
MGRDEQKAFDLLNKNRQIQKPIIEEYSGIWIKELGDGVMASFKTVSDAVNAAIKIQQTCNTAKEFQLRIGIHQGEVVIEENDMFGDAVNIASRIQSIASPGSIFVSEVVHHNVSNKNDIQTEFVKTENLKNVREPVKIYRIKFDGSPPAPHRPLKSIKRKSLVFIFVAVMALGLTGYFIIKGQGKGKVEPEIIDRSIAVLPFDNRSNDKEQEYFSDGLSEELINMLTRIPELKVIGRTSSFAFKGKNEDLRTIGQKLDVAHLLEGSVQKDGNKIRVTTTLIRASDGKGIWNDSYDRDLSNIFELQDEIAQTVVRQLRLKLLQFPSTHVSGSGNIDAYNLVLQGNYFYDKLDKENVAKAVDFYRQALAIDSTNARAWGKLANAISRQAWQNYIDQNPGYEKARHAALKAISLDNTLAVGYLELADIKLYHDFDWKGAEETYQKALSLEPQNAEIIIGNASLNEAIGSWKEAARFYRQAIDLDPLKPIYYLGMGNNQTAVGQINEAILSFKKALDIDPRFQRAHLYQGINYLLLGKTDLALKEMEQENNELFKTFGLALAYHALGRKPEADETLKDFTDKYQNNWSYLLAQLHAFRGENDEAFSWLETAYNKKDSWLFWLKGDPLLKNLKTDPRYKAFLKKMNLKPD